MKYIVYPVLTILGVLLTCIMWVYIGNVGSVLESTGFSLETWLGFALLWCIGSGIAAGGLSRDIAIWSTDTDIIVENHPVLAKLERIAQSLEMKHRPQFGVYPSPEKNIFSAGPLPSHSIVAVSQGFLSLHEDVQEALLYSELKKVQNGDTALLGYCHGVVHGFVLYLARMLAFLLGTSFRNTEGSSSSTVPEIILSAVATLFLTLWGSLVVYFFSRQRNLMGDSWIRQTYGEDRLRACQKALYDSPKEDQHYDLFTKALKANFPRRKPLA